MKSRGPLLVAVHPSQFPGELAHQVAKGLRTKSLPTKVHYLSPHQARAWLALHAKYSPYFTAPDGAEIYERLSLQAARRLPSDGASVISLGCGGGQKDARLLDCLHGRRLSYVPADASLELVLTAVERAGATRSAPKCLPHVLDLDAVDDWDRTLTSDLVDREPRVILFYGMLPNMDPVIAGPRLAALLRPGDLLLLSANLASGTDYERGTRLVLPMYDNLETRAWLALALEDLGLSPVESEWRYEIAPARGLEGLLGIEVSLRFETAKRVALGSEVIELPAGESLRIFRSNRYTHELVCVFLESAGIDVLDRAISRDGQEGVFLAAKP